jgi:hypothetical protein
MGINMSLYMHTCPECNNTFITNKFIEDCNKCDCVCISERIDKSLNYSEQTKDEIKELKE